MSNPLLFSFSCLLAAALMGCAPPRDPMGITFWHGDIPVSTAPNTLSADIEIRPLQPKGATPFHARVFAEPHKRYRVEALGLASASVASYLWNSGSWTLLMHPKRQVVTGMGDELDIEGEALKLPDVHAILGFIWGEPMPGFWNPGSEASWSNGSARWSYRGMRWQAFFSPTTGGCYEVRSQSISIRYGKPHRFGNRIIPATSQVFLDGRHILNIRLRKLEENPAWAKDPFLMPIPKEYAQSQAPTPLTDENSPLF